MPTMAFKTVILYDERRIRPQTLERIANAKDGEMIGCDVSELGSFVPLVVHEVSVEKLRKPKPKPELTSKGLSTPVVE